MDSRKGQACDGCRLRKVKCRGETPCTQCAHLNLSCTFSTPANRRRHGPRGWLVTQLRDGNNATVDTVQRRLEIPPATTRSIDFYSDLLPVFEEFVYPLNPIIPPQEIREAIMNKDTSHEDAALVNAFAAITINRTQSSWVPHGEVAALMTDLMRCSLEAYWAVDLDSFSPYSGTLRPLSISIKRILTTIFLSTCATTLGRLDRSCAILREGITMLQTVDMQRNPPEKPADIARWQRLYWTVYLHERHLALLPNYSSVLTTLRTGLPVVDPKIPSHIDVGFRRLLHLFLVLDDTFLAHWRAQQDPGLPAQELTAEWIERKQAQLDEDAAGTTQEERELRESGSDSLTELQRIDLTISRLWMRTLIWQLALSRGLLYSVPSATAHEGLSLHFPIHSIFREVRFLFDRLENVTSVGFHGMGMLEKLFEITSTIADVLSLMNGPENVGEEAISRVNDLIFFIKFLSSFDATPKKHRDYLQEKLYAMQNILVTGDSSHFVGIESAGL